MELNELKDYTMEYVYYCHNCKREFEAYNEPTCCPHCNSVDIEVRGATLEFK